MNTDSNAVRLAELERIASHNRDAELDHQVVSQKTATLLDDEDDVADRRLREADAILRSAHELVATQDEAQRARLKASFREHADALYAGDAERAAEVMAEVVADATRPDPKAVAANVRREIDLERGLDRFKRDYPEIIADPVLVSLADDCYAAAIAAGKDEIEALEVAGSETRRHLRRLAGEMGIATTDATEQAAEPQASAVINEMRRARGQ